MKKRVISGLLALTLVLSGASPIGEIVGLPTAGSVIKVSALYNENFEYYILDNGTAEIASYTGKAAKLVIPTKIDGKKVTSIRGFAFRNCKSLTSVTIPGSVTSIGEYAFGWCENLTSIAIPGSVTSIDGSAFSGTPWLDNKRKNNPLVISNGILIDGRTCTGSVTIPDRVTTISSNAFFECSDMKSVTIPDSVTRIEDGAFFKCSGLKSVAIPNSITRIENYTFYSCTNLTSITIPKSVRSIGLNAFNNCKSLKDVYYEGSKGDWDRITNGGNNDCLTAALIHYNSDPAHEHSYTSVITKQATCTAEGTKTTRCSTCGDTYTESIPAKGHKFILDTSTPPTCTERGKKTYHCGRCATGRVEVTPAKGHSYATKVVAPTYKSQGYTIHTCKVCGDSYKDNYKPKKKFRTSIKNAKISVATQTYNGKALKPKVTVKVGSKTLKSGTDYTVSYKNNKNTGKATVTVTGKNTYTGTKTASFIIKPKKAKLTKVISPKTKQVKLKWKKDSQATGYQLQVALNKKFSSGRKTVNISKKTTTAKTIKSLKKGKKYYARVRAYKKVGKTKYYGNWSALKTVRCK